MALKADIIEVRPRNDATFDSTLGILRNGTDNNYPTRVERITNSSVTAKQCTKMLAKFIFGQGFVSDTTDDSVIGRDKSGDITLLKFLKRVCMSLSMHQGVFIHINYNILGEKSSVSVLPYRWCRFIQEEKEGEITGVAVYDNWDRSKGVNIRKEKIDKFPFYSPDSEIVKKQITEAGGIALYKGQVLFATLDEMHIYPLATVDPAINDADTDAQIGVFKNKTLRNGFMVKTILRHSPFDGESDRDDFKENVKDWQGAENAETILLVEDEFNSDFPNGQLKVDQLETKINDKLFEAWENSIPNKIRKCFNNIPPMLVDYVEGKLGGTSGESYKFAIDFYNSQTEEERLFVTQLMEEVFSNFSTPINMSFDILPISGEFTANELAEDTKLVDAINSLSPLVANKVMASMTTNEIRGIVGLETVEGGDEIPAIADETIPTNEPAN